jgi:hypothetical protein
VENWRKVVLATLAVVTVLGLLACGAIGKHLWDDHREYDANFDGMKRWILAVQEQQRANAQRQGQPPRAPQVAPLQQPAPTPEK